MSAGIALFADPDLEFQIEELALSEVQEAYTEDFSEGQPVQVYGLNNGDSSLRDLSLHLTGQGAGKVQLAVDRDGEPGVWADAGQSITLSQFSAPGESFTFWARAVFTQEDREGSYDLGLQFRGVAIG